MNTSFRLPATRFANASTMFSVIGMAFRKFIMGDSFYVEDVNGGKAVHVEAQAEGFFEVAIPGLPNDDLEVRSVEVHVEEGVAGIGDKELSDIREFDVVGVFDLGFFSDGDVLKVHPRTKGILRGGKSVRGWPSDRERAPHSSVGIEGSVDKGGEEDPDRPQFDDKLT